VAALASSPEGADPARLAHHAEGAGEAAAVLELAPAAAHRGAQLRAHRAAAPHDARAPQLGANGEASAQYASALRFAGSRPPQERARLLSRLADAQYATDDQVD